MIASLAASVVVPTYRRPDLLERCLNALLSQTFAPSDYEIIIVDDGPESPETRRLVETWQHRMEPLQRRLAGGCHLTRDVKGLVTDAGFQVTDLETA